MAEERQEPSVPHVPARSFSETEVSVGGNKAGGGIAQVSRARPTQLSVIPLEPTDVGLLPTVLLPDGIWSWASLEESPLPESNFLRSDVVLLTASAPGVRAFQWLHAAAQDSSRAGKPALIFVFERATDAVIAELLQAGAADVLVATGARELNARVSRAIDVQRTLRQLQAQAQTDALTGLPNFRSLQERLEEEFARAERYHAPVSVLMLDLDGLKPLNDGFGHEVGNRAIVSLASELRRNLRPMDFAARYGGDEFCVVMPHQTSVEASVLAERLREHLRPLTLRPRRQVPLTISVGVASHSEIFPKDGPSALLEAADHALYEAKRLGRNRVVLYERDLEHPPGGALRH